LKKKADYKEQKTSVAHHVPFSFSRRKGCKKKRKSNKKAKINHFSDYYSRGKLIISNTENENGGATSQKSLEFSEC
jgi:hypothetical protein